MRLMPRPNSPDPTREAGDVKRCRPLFFCRDACSRRSNHTPPPNLKVRAILRHGLQITDYPSSRSYLPSLLSTPSTSVATLIVRDQVRPVSAEGNERSAKWMPINSPGRARASAMLAKKADLCAKQSSIAQGLTARPTCEGIGHKGEPAEGQPAGPNVVGSKESALKRMRRQTS
jgi:hypothetical protein